MFQFTMRGGKGTVAFWRKVLSIAVVASVFLLPRAAACFALEQVPETLSLEEAVAMALSSSPDVRTAEDTVELKKLARDEAWDRYVDVMGSTYLGDGMYLSLPAGQDPTPAYYKADYDLRAARKDYEVKVASVVAAVYQRYSAVVTAQRQVEAAGLNVAVKERELADAEARFKCGMESRINLVQKRSNLTAARSELAQAEDKLDKAYADLAELLGLPRGSKPALVSTMDFVPLEVEDVDREIDRIIEASPQVWKAEEAVRLQKRTYGMVNSNDVDEINLRMAERVVDVTKQELYLGLLQAYNNVKALEENYRALEQSLATAREGLRVARLKYDLGMSTRAEVLSLESSVASLEVQMENLKWQHAMAVKAFYEPWAWSGSSGGSS
ncbi:TolC family protein [Moorellaceae bacterium AZ2]